jgi:hypothetical protein
MICRQGISYPPCVFVKLEFVFVELNLWQVDEVLGQAASIYVEQDEVC